MPLATNNQLKNQIELKIGELANFATVNKALILTETDLQCQIYKKLSEIEDLNTFSNTNDGFLTNKIHTEISWFSDNNTDRLSIRPDITLLEPENLRITSRFNGTPLPSKGLHSIDGGIIMELKFDRNLKTISEKNFRGIDKDIKNIEKIHNRFSSNGIGNQIYSYLILFIKSPESSINRGKIRSIQQELNNRGLNDSKCKFIYHFIGVSLKGKK
jgi:hypothetical protein